MTPNRILQGDVLARLADLPEASVHCVVTSPPYWGLRDYQCDGQYGLEPTLGEYLERMVAVFREVRRVLRPDGTLWLNMGDSYAASTTARHARGKAGGPPNPQRQKPSGGLKPKDLCGVPWRLAFALQDDGWWLRSDIIWHKPNPMPSSVTDRPGVDHEYLFLLSRGRRYFYDADAVREPAVKLNRSSTRPREGDQKKSMKAPPLTGNHGSMGADGLGHRYASVYCNPAGRNLRTVWTIPTEPFPDAHFATFPSRLVERCIKAATSHAGVCPECGAPWVRVADGWRASCVCGRADTVPAIVLDPFMGSGTTALTALAMGRDYLGIELNPDYVAMAERRIARRMQDLSLVRPPEAEERGG